MKLAKLLSGIDIKEGCYDPELEITGVSYDSRQTKPGEAFVAIPGFASDGYRFIPKALERGAVVTDARMRTNVPGVWAIGDCNGKLMLAHTAYREAEVAVNDMLGKKDRIDYSIIPSVIYTTPEVACVGETEQSAKEKGLDVQIVKVPMALSGRYLAENPKGDGFCKLLYDLKNRCVVGVHLVGSYASEIIYGAAMMVHSKLPVQHLDKIVFPHPTVGEVVREALFLL